MKLLTSHAAQYRVNVLVLKCISSCLCRNPFNTENFVYVSSENKFAICRPEGGGGYDDAPVNNKERCN